VGPETEIGVVTVLDARPANALSVRRWVALCAAAEAIGMTAAAAAATTATRVVGEPDGGREVAAVLSLVVLGGLVEGVALGVLQAAGVHRLVPALRVGRWIAPTVLVAGVGWAAASAPAALAGPGGGDTPPVALVLVGAAALGATMGAALGAAQASALRGHVAHPWRWVGVNVWAWAAAMPIIFLGATTAEADWPVVAVAALGTATGLAAGTVLGLVSGPLMAVLQGPPTYSLLTAALLRSPLHRLLDGALVVLRLHGRVSGRLVELPVQYAADGPTLVLAPGRPETKRWWRNLREPAPVRVLLRGRWQDGVGVVLERGSAGYDAAVAVYERRWPRARLTAGQPVVRVTLDATS